METEMPSWRGVGAACYTLVYLRRKINIFFCLQERIFKFKVSFCQHSHGWHIELFTSFSFHLEPVFLGIRIIMMRIQSSCLKQIRIRLFIIKNTISITLYRFHFLNIFNASWYFSSRVNKWHFKSPPPSKSPNWVFENTATLSIYPLGLNS